MRFRFGRKFLLPLWLVSLMTGCAWAIPVISPLAPNHQYPVYADVSYDDTPTPDRYIDRYHASYEATYRYTWSPLVAGVSEIPLRLRVAHGKTTVRSDRTSTGETTLARCEIFFPFLERIGSGRAVAVAGANAEGRLCDDRTTQLMLIRGGLENPRLTSEWLGIRRSENPESSDIFYSPTRSRVELNTWEAVKGTRIVRNEKAVRGPNPYGSKALQHKSELVEAGNTRGSDIPVNPAGAPANLSTTNEGVVRQEVQHNCAAVDVDRCIPDF